MAEYNDYYCSGVTALKCVAAPEVLSTRAFEPPVQMSTKWKRKIKCYYYIKSFDCMDPLKGLQRLSEPTDHTWRSAGLKHDGMRSHSRHKCTGGEGHGVFGSRDISGVVQNTQRKCQETALERWVGNGRLGRAFCTALSLQSVLLASGSPFFSFCHNTHSVTPTGYHR